jgi:hypothetical protein
VLTVSQVLTGVMGLTVISTTRMAMLQREEPRVRRFVKDS